MITPSVIFLSWYFFVGWFSSPRQTRHDYIKSAKFCRRARQARLMLAARYWRKNASWVASNTLSVRARVHLWRRLHIQRRLQKRRRCLQKRRRSLKLHLACISSWFLETSKVFKKRIAFIYLKTIFAIDRNRFWCNLTPGTREKSPSFVATECIY